MNATHWIVVEIDQGRGFSQYRQGVGAHSIWSVGDGGFLTPKSSPPLLVHELDSGSYEIPDAQYQFPKKWYNCKIPRNFYGNFVSSRKYRVHSDFLSNLRIIFEFRFVSLHFEKKIIPHTLSSHKHFIKNKQIIHKLQSLILTNLSIYSFHPHRCIHTDFCWSTLCTLTDW